MHAEQHHSHCWSLGSPTPQVLQNVYKAFLFALVCGWGHRRIKVVWSPWVNGWHRKGLWRGWFGLFWKREWGRRRGKLTHYLQPWSISNYQNFSFSISWQTAMFQFILLFTLWSYLSFSCVPVRIFMYASKQTLSEKAIKLNQLKRHKHTPMAQSFIHMQL